MISPPRFTFWWLHPAWCLSFVCGITLLVAYLQDPVEYELYRTTKYLKLWHVLVGFLTILTFSVGCYFGRETTPANAAKTVVNYRVLKRWFYFCVGLTLFGYAVWLGVGFKNGASPTILLDVVLSNDPSVVGSIREDLFPTIPGVTTCTQFGLPAMVLGLWIYFFDDRRVLRWVVIIAILAVLRAILNSERLALIELAVPAAILLARIVVLPMKHLWVRKAGAIAPLVAPLLLAMVFGSFEYVRSWQFYADDFDSYPRFVVWRLTGYYTTAHNNAAMAIETDHYPPIPYFTIEPLWKLPGVESSSFGYQNLTGTDIPDYYRQMLENFGNPELNNSGGLFHPLLDWGLPISLIFWLGYGVLAGRLYNNYLRGTLSGVLFYPLIFLTLLDVPRLLIICNPRFTPTIAVMILVVVTSQVPKNGRPST